MISQTIDSIVAHYVKSDEPSGSVAVIKDGEVIHCAGYGLANLEWDIPNMPDTVFRIGSVTKQFTAVAILMLQEQGKLHVDDLITKYVAEFPTSGHDVTIHHLLTHTSGIWNHTNHPDFLRRCRQDLTPREIAEEFWSHPFDFRPGTRWNYSNSGYLLLGMIIEQVFDAWHAIMSVCLRPWRVFILLPLPCS